MSRVASLACLAVLWLAATSASIGTLAEESFAPPASTRFT